MTIVKFRKQDTYVSIPELLFFIEDLSINKKFLLLIFAEASYKTGDLSLNYLKSICGVTKPTIIKGLKFLEWLEWIEVKKFKSDNGENNINYYSLDFEFVKKCLELFKNNNVSLKEIETYFDNLYKNNKEKLKEKCVFINEIE